MKTFQVVTYALILSCGGVPVALQAPDGGLVNAANPDTSVSGSAKTVSCVALGGAAYDFACTSGDWGGGAPASCAPSGDGGTMASVCGCFSLGFTQTWQPCRLLDPENGDCIERAVAEDAGVDCSFFLSVYASCGSFCPQ